ncbi:MAG: DUF748 domain-containing protein [Halioglobus sp.]
MRTVLRILAILYLAYLAITLLVITPALNLLPHWYLQDTYGRELRTGWVLLNPFKLSLDVREAALDDASGKPFIAFEKASVNLSLEGLWQPGWVLDEVTVKGLELQVTRLGDGVYNFSDLLAGDAATAPPATEAGPSPDLTIHNLDVHAATIAVTDEARDDPFSARWHGLHIQVAELSTVIDQGRPFSVDVEAEGGGTLHWQGEISLPAESSTGTLTLSGLNLRNVWLFAQPWLQLELKDGRLDVESEYQVAWGDALSFRIDEGHVRLSAIDIAPRSPDQIPDTAVRLRTLDIHDIEVDSATRQVNIDAVDMDGVEVATWREDAQVSLQPLFAVNLPASGAAADDDSGAPWRVNLNRAQLRDSSLHWRSAITDPPVLDVRPLAASVEHITWPLSGDTRISLNASVNDQAQIAINGSLALDPGNGTIDYALEGLPVTWFNPNLPKALKATVTGGQVEVKGQLALQDYAPTTIALGGAVRDFSARQEGAEEALTGWDSVRFEGLAVDLQQHSLVLEKLAIDTYTGRLHIHKDGSVNASNIWKEEVGEQAQQIADDLTEDKPWSFSIPVIAVSDSAIDFMDESLPIVFRTVIGDLDGEVRDISSDEGAVARVNMNGSVDGYAPVTLKGKVAPFAAPADLDLKLTFDGVDMALLSPYSAEYAGYAIDRGLLNLRLHYALKDNHLQGDNAIRIDKLKLGKKIASDKAVDLPLEFALAILTDANGVIDMAVPVTGDVNKPGFDLSSVISKAIINLITKAVTAPFSLLAGLAGTEDDLQHLNFTSGSAVLKDANQQKLTELASALAQRPKLSVVITGRLNLTADRQRLQRNALKAQLLEAGLSAEEIKAKGPAWEKAIAERFSALPAGDAENPDMTPREQYDEVVQAINVTDEEMIALAEARAVAVKRYLLNDAGLAPERAVVGQSRLEDAANEFSGVELGIGD